MVSRIKQKVRNLQSDDVHLPRGELNNTGNYSTTFRKSTQDPQGIYEDSLTIPNLSYQSTLGKDVGE